MELIEVKVPLEPQNIIGEILTRSAKNSSWIFLDQKTMECITQVADKVEKIGFIIKIEYSSGKYILLEPCLSDWWKLSYIKRAKPFVRPANPESFIFIMSEE